MEPNDLKENIRKLEEEKRKLIHSIKKLNDRKRYKSYEQRALKPFVEKTKEVETGYLRKQMRSLEFRIETQAYTPQKEREILKSLKKLQLKYDKVREVEKARRKLKLVTQDIEQIDQDVEKIETRLKKIREDLNDYYKKQKMNKVAKSKGITLGKPDEEFSLMDLAGMEEKD